MISKNYNKLNELKNQIEKWQSNDYVHPLTCGNNSQHEDLIVNLHLVDKLQMSYELTLVCNDCDWVQDIPMFFTGEL